MKLKAQTISIEKLPSSTIDDLFSLYSKYYEGINYIQFSKDLSQKKKIIIIRNSDNQLAGFSTLTTFTIKSGTKRIKCIYSGDTVIEKKYWGTSALTIEFLKNIIIEKMKSPFTQVWWFLISKGYKTYLLMANNFHEYYPCYNKETPIHKKTLIRDLCEIIYPGHLDEQKGLLYFEKDHDKLKEYVAPITETMCKENPKINYFQLRNPHWSNGDELACIGKVSFLLGVTHPLKILIKQLKKNAKRLSNAYESR